MVSGIARGYLKLWGVTTGLV